MAGRIEFITPEGLRIDGRRPNEVRRIQCKLGVLPGCDGSASFQMGNTIAIASVYGPHEALAGRKGVMQPQNDVGATITCEYTISGFATRDHRRRVRDRTTTETAQAIAQAMSAVVQTSLLPRTSTIGITVTVVQEDGGAKACAINAATLALVDAGVPMVDVLCCCAAGCVNETPILDMNHQEEASGCADIPLAQLARTGRISLLQMDSKLPLATFKETVALASVGCSIVYKEMVKAMKIYAAQSIEKRGFVSKVTELFLN